MSPRVRNTARVTPQEAVPNRVPRGRKVTASAKATAQRHVSGPPEGHQRLTMAQVHPKVMEAAKGALRPGERLQVVSATEVWLVPNRH